MSKKMEVKMISLDRIRYRENPYISESQHKTAVECMKREGWRVCIPLYVVYDAKADMYMPFVETARLDAAHDAGIKEVPCIVVADIIFRV